MLKFYEGVSVAGENLKDALYKEYEKNEYRSVIHKWYENEIEANLNDKDRREEYMPKHDYNVYVVIGKKKRELFINQVRAGNKKHAIKKCLKDIKAEFKGIKFKVKAEHYKSDMTEDKFNEMITNQVWEDNPFDWLSKEELENDKRVAELFGLSGKVESYETDNGNVIDVKDVIGFCQSCGSPITRNMIFCFNEGLKESKMEDNEFEDDDCGLCEDCGGALKSFEIKDKDIQLVVCM